MMNIGLVDDDNVFLEKFKQMIMDAVQSIAMICDVKCFNDGISHMEELLSCDIVFFDIEMPQISGLDLSEEMRKQMSGQELPLVVFVTSKDSYVYTALSYYPFSFIRKSCAGEEIAKCLSQAKKRIDMLKSDSRLIQLNKGKELVPIKEIMYIEKEGNEIVYRGKNGDHRVRSTMKKVIKELENKGFIRIHEGFAVNIDYISCMGVKEVFLSNGKSLIIGRVYKERAKRSYCEWLNKKARTEMW